MNDVKTWLCSNMDYSQGVEIFALYCKNKVFVRTLKNSNPNKYAQKLEYEMKRLLNIPLSAITSQKCSNQQLINTFFIRGGKSGEIGKNNTKIEKGQRGQGEQDIISRAKELRNDLKTQIAIIHNQLYDLGEQNTQQIVDKRKALLDKRIPLIAKYEDLYQAIEEYFLTFIIPDNLNDLLKDNYLVITEDKTTDYEKLPDIQLVNTKNNLVSRIAKQKNIINFQSYTAQQQANPMPEGPKRKKAEEKLKHLIEEHDKVVKIINSRK